VSPTPRHAYFTRSQATEEKRFATCALTASPSSGQTAPAARIAGFGLFLSKPVRAAEFAIRIRELPEGGEP
jgi:hypothetical protein